MVVDKVLVSTIYIVLAMVLVSLSGTYSVTKGLFGGLVGQKDQASYGTGLHFSNRGFLLHIVVFALLVGVPMYLLNKNKLS